MLSSACDLVFYYFKQMPSLQIGSFCLLIEVVPLHTRPSPIHSSSTVSLQVQVGIPWISAVHGIPSRSETGFLLYRTEFLIIVRSDLCSIHASPFWCQVSDIPAHPCLKDALSLETLAAAPLTFSVGSILLHIARRRYTYGKITSSRVRLLMQLALWINPDLKGQLQESLIFSSAFCWEWQVNHTNDLKTLWGDLLTTSVPRLWPQASSGDWE